MRSPVPRAGIRAAPKGLRAARALPTSRPTRPTPWLAPGRAAALRRAYKSPQQLLRWLRRTTTLPRPVAIRTRARRQVRGRPSSKPMGLFLRAIPSMSLLATKPAVLPRPTTAQPPPASRTYPTPNGAPRLPEAEALLRDGWSRAHRLPLTASKSTGRDGHGQPASIFKARVMWQKTTTFTIL